MSDEEIPMKYFNLVELARHLDDADNHRFYVDAEELQIFFKMGMTNIQMKKIPDS